MVTPSCKRVQVISLCDPAYVSCHNPEMGIFIFKGKEESEFQVQLAVVLAGESQVCALRTMCVQPSPSS